MRSRYAAISGVNVSSEMRYRPSPKLDTAFVRPVLVTSDHTFCGIEFVLTMISPTDVALAGTADLTRDKTFEPAVFVAWTAIKWGFVFEFVLNEN